MMVTRLYEWDKNETWWNAIEVTDNKVINLLLRSEDNLLKVDQNELYCDLQLDSWVAITDTLPVWVNVGRVLAADGRPVTWTLISGQTTSWDRVKVLYGDDWKIRVDNGTWEWKILQYELNAWLWIEIWDYYTNQWPAPVGFHIPTIDELSAVSDIMTALGLATLWGEGLKQYLKMPYAWQVSWNKWTDWYYLSCNNRWDNTDWYLSFYNNSINISRWPKSQGLSIRCFKNKSVSPDLSWTTLFDGSSIATWAWIFHDTVNWLISISADWQNWITIQDKNLWATTVYNDGDVLSQSNCWNFFQRWNNYGFDWNWAITTSSIKVDASWYWPWNYYSSNVFIDAGDSWDWSSVTNNNLRWWVTWIIENAINNTWVLSVDWKTWHVLVEQPNVCEITVQLVDTDYIWTATKIWDLVDGATIIWHSNGLQGLQWLSIAWVSYTILNWIWALDNWTHFYGIYREWYWVIIYSFNNN